MTSLFDFAEAGAGLGEMPVDLLTGGGRGVSPLEFFVLDEEETERFAEERAEPAGESAEERAGRERAAQMQAMIDAARADAAAEARRGFEHELEARLRAERMRVERMCAEFAQDRQRYFAAAEEQVVKLALAIARRVLSREAAADALHLRATVRAALARVQEGSTSVLRVRGQEVERWTALLADAREGSVAVVGDERLGAGECVLETEVGRVELGVEVQMDEIQRGFSHVLHRQGE
jgi:flagellar assembly protein FliH